MTSLHLLWIIPLHIVVLLIVGTWIYDWSRDTIEILAIYGNLSIIEGWFLRRLLEHAP